MKTLVLFGILFAVLLAGVRSEDDSSEEDWSSEEEECVNQLKLKKEDIQAINKEVIVPEDNTDFNNYLACYWTAKKTLTPEGEIDPVKVQAEFREEFRKEFGKNPDIDGIILGGLIRTAIYDCSKAKIEGDTHGQIVAKTQNCVFANVMKGIADASQEDK